jgi:catechol 2,3-dioxygenase-like lactoylglutathione lyase family enzyme
MTIKGIQHVGIPTNDIKKTVAFWESLGFKRVLETTNDGNPVCFLKIKDTIIETYENHQGTMRYGAIDHICLGTDDIEEAFKFVKKLGHPILEGKIITLPFWEKGFRYFTVEGPNKEKVEFGQVL